MRRRLLQATISALAVAVILLGIPLGFFVAQLVKDQALRDLELRTVTAARALDVRLRSGEPITEDILGSYVSSARGAGSYIYVRLPDGEELSAGTEPDATFADSYVSESGIVVVMSVAWWDVFWQAVRYVGLVIAVGLVAIIAGVSIAIWQSNRLVAPLIYLAASAEQLGSGQVRPRMKDTGIEEIDQVADELARSADRMAARLAGERQFAADASHQLRTPLTALTMRLEEIAATTTQDDVREEADKSLEQVERLVGVVDDLLGRSRRSLGPDTELVLLRDVLDQQREEWRQPFEAAGRELEIRDSNATVFASPGGLSQVLATLLENSLHHGAGTTIVAARESGTNHAIVIEVVDQGEGVPEDLAPRIFEREVTGGSGTGLGLALARDLVTANGGRLELSQRAPAAFAVFLQGVPQMVDLEDVVPHGKTLRQGRR